VWEQENLSKTVPVRPDGMISLPLINDVQAAGRTPMQLMNTLVEKLTTLGVKSPLVTVTVTSINSQRIYVLGQVARAGAYPMIPGMTVLQAIASAGGLGQFAKQSKIEIRRTENGKLVMFPFNYKDVLRGKHSEQDILLKPGDTIVVP
jgi:polysaccharide export outer membrane protein